MRFLHSHNRSNELMVNWIRNVIPFGQRRAQCISVLILYCLCVSFVVVFYHFLFFVLLSSCGDIILVVPAIDLSPVKKFRFHSLPLFHFLLVLVIFLSSDYDNSVMAAARQLITVIGMTRRCWWRCRRWKEHERRRRRRRRKLSVTSAGYHDNWLREMSMRRGFPF